jgi:uncharacterized damage-inducible protein DinB
MTIGDALELFLYNRWANDRTIASVDALTDEQRARDLGSSFPTVLRTAAHIAAAEWVWLSRWKGTSPTTMPVWVERPEWASVRTRFAELERERQGFLSTLADADVSRVVSFTLFNGTPDAQPLGRQFQHLVNHGTYHRGQIAGMLRQLGAQPASTDLIRWAREQA